MLSRLPSDLRGAARLATDATVGVAGIAEAVHAQFALRRSTRQSGRKRGIAGFVYRMVRRIARLSGRGAEAALRPLDRLARDVAEAPASPRRGALVAALNGVLGDGLEATGNPLAIPMRLRRDGRDLDLTRGALAAAIPGATPHVVVLVHGLCMNDAQWTVPSGHDHGAALERDTALTAVTLHYNTGRHISANGREFADELERLVAAWPVPVESLSLLCHSMGGLVSRSAAHVAMEQAMAWPRALRRIVFLATPHHGSPLERGGNRLDRALLRSRFSAPLARVGHIRSAGITDLRYGNLLEEDWSQHNRFEAHPDRRRPVPLPAGVEAFAMAATAGAGPGEPLGRLPAWVRRAVGDGLVPLVSALGQHPDLDLGIPDARTHVSRGMHHFGLLGADVYPIVRGWLDPARSSAPLAC